ncbi:IS1634 family transposase [Candidatus Aerophobetes bacterium Ae_b3b]|nr:MAG: IS1634 family transposase [Candidatus Aerophobetes bacterium Ae_b3b]
MFVRTKTFVNKDGSKRVYLQIAKSVWENGKPHQRVICTLGRLKDLKRGGIDTLIRGLGKFTDKLQVIEISKDLLAKDDKEYGAPLIFHRLFKLLSLEEILESCLASHNHTFNVKEAIFAMVLNRIISASSKLRVYEWLDDIHHPVFKILELQHLYRSLDFLDEHKEKIEEDLFERVKSLFNLKLDVVFYDTTSIYFEGDGPENLATKGFSRDNRPDTNQVVIGILMTGEGIPVGCESFPGNFHDAKTLKVALRSLSRRFRIRRIIFVADRGMVSEKNLSLIEEEDYDYIVGVKMRGLKRIRDFVLSTPGRYKDVEDNLKVKEVKLNKGRYIICYNPHEAEKDKMDRDEIIKNLQEKTKTGSLGRVLTGDAKRFCKIEAKKIIIDKERTQKEARYDGKYVLQTSTDLSSEEVARAYKNLWMIEHAFRDIKDIFKIRPIFHWTPSRVRGHIFICFLAFLLTVSLQKRLSEIGIKESVWKVIRDVQKIRAVKLFIKDKAYLVRTELQGLAHRAFRAVGLRVPPQVQEL